MEFCVDRTLIFPRIRPHHLEKAVFFSAEHIHIREYRERLLEKSNECPVLIYRLYKRGYIIFEEMERFLKKSDCFLLSYYFRKEIDDFGNFIETKQRPSDIDDAFLANSDEIDKMIEYGFLPKSIEYCLKYDVFEEIANFEILNQESKWSPFEWSNKPDFLDYLSISGFFGSIRCFKHLLMNG